MTGRSSTLPHLTVAIPTYNRAGYLRLTLQGIVQQTYPREQFEVLVIDNNSTDETRAVVESFRGNSVNIQYILETQQGLDYARNRAIAEARGEIIIFGDDDILMGRDWIVQMNAPFSADQSGRIGAVGGEVIPVFPDGLPPWVAEWHAPLAFRPENGPLPSKHSPMGANLAFPKRILKSWGDSIPPWIARPEIIFLGATVR